MLDIPVDYDCKKPHSRKKLTDEILAVRTNFKVLNRHIICKKFGIKDKKFRIFKGLKRCTTCDINFDTNDIICPCCKRRLRIKQRVKTHRPDFARGKFY